MPKDETASRQPYSITSQVVTGTITVPDIEIPKPEIPKAMPRRLSNQLASSVLFGIGPASVMATPSMRP